MRYYDPGIARFMARDMLAKAVALGRTSPEQLMARGIKLPIHPFAYVGNNPTGAVDPSGLRLVVTDQQRRVMENFFGKDNVTFERLENGRYVVEVSDEGWKHLDCYVEKTNGSKRFARQLKEASLDPLMDVPLERVHELDPTQPPLILARDLPQSWLKDGDDRPDRWDFGRGAPSKLRKEKRELEEQRKLVRDAVDMIVVPPLVSLLQSLLEHRREYKERTSPGQQ